MPNTVAQIRRAIGQNMKYWGGHAYNGGSGTFSANGTSNTAIDTTRPEADGEWNNCWIVINPGSTDQAGAPTIWRFISPDSGWLNSTGQGTFQIVGSWPAPYAAGPTAGTKYEIYKNFRPEEWLNAINAAIRRSFPARHVPVNIEIPEDARTKIIDWARLVMNLSVVDPAAAPVPTVSTTAGSFKAGTYTVAYTYYNDVGESLVSPGATVVLADGQAIDIAAITGLPSTARGVRYYMSIEPGSTQLAFCDAGDAILQAGQAVTYPGVGMHVNSGVGAVTFTNPPRDSTTFPPAVNTTATDAIDLRRVQVRTNPGQYPEEWQDLGDDMWSTLGGTQIKINYYETGNKYLRLVCIATVAPLSNETDTTTEPLELLYTGAEAYLWELLIKQSPGDGQIYQPNLKAVSEKFDKLKKEFAFDAPPKPSHRPYIKSGVSGGWLNEY